MNHDLLEQVLPVGLSIGIDAANLVDQQLVFADLFFKLNCDFIFWHAW